MELGHEQKNAGIRSNTMNFSHLFLIAIIMFTASAIQSAIGFGLALFATPLFIWVGVPLPGAIAISGTCAFIQAMLGTRHLYAHIPWALTFKGFGYRMIFYPVGLFILWQVAGLNIALIKFVVGSVLLLVVGSLLLFKIHPREHISFGWTITAFGASGLLSGLCGMGGPPVVLWSFAHTWPAQKIRGFLFSLFSLCNPIDIIILCITFGSAAGTYALTALALSPAVLLGAFAGLPLGTRIPRQLLEKIAYAILVGIGFYSVFSFMVELMGSH